MFHISLLKIIMTAAQEHNPETLYNTITCMSDYRRGSGLKIGFTDHFNTLLMAIFNYSSIPDLHTLQIPTAHAKSIQSAVFTSRSLVTVSNSGDSSACAPTLLPAGSQQHRQCLLFTALLQLNWLVKVKVKVTLRLTVSQSVCLGVEPRLGLMTRYLFTVW
jgi:hypothetical protein